MEIVSFGSVAPALGTTAHGWVVVPGLEPRWELPVFVARGRHPGPTLAITAGFHAGEAASIAAVMRFGRELDPTQMRGTVVGVHVVNTPGFFERTEYVNPRDLRNVNRVFPGSAGVDPSEPVAAFLMSEMLACAEAYVDTHGGDRIEALSSYALWPGTGIAAVDEVSERLALVYGLDNVLKGDPVAAKGRAWATVSTLGIPTVLAEAGSQGFLDVPAVARHCLGLNQVLRALGMVDRAPVQVAPARRLSALVWLDADCPAAFHPSVALGASVTAGQNVGDLCDLLGATLRTLFSPATGVVLCLARSLAIRPGDHILGVVLLDNSASRSSYGNHVCRGCFAGTSRPGKDAVPGLFRASSLRWLQGLSTRVHTMIAVRPLSNARHGVDGGGGADPG
jgi:predicted deacylase